MRISEPHGGRALTHHEIALASTIFGDAIEYASVRIVRRKWAFFQPRDTVMAPTGHIHFHPGNCRYCDDFGAASRDEQGLFIHEMTHVWQHQQGIFLPLRRPPFARYRYTVEPGKPFRRYGLEQQAEIVRHAFLWREGYAAPTGAARSWYENILPFGAARSA